jgi:PhnB protein
LPESASENVIAPWLSLRDSGHALDFYKAAFGAVETHRTDTPDGVIARLSVGGAQFWISPGGEETRSSGPEAVGGATIRLILVVSDPDAAFARALAAGATEVFPVGEAHGWRLGRLTDPFGLDWEIGRELA